jgi:predicted small lipoprotein YifL
MKKLLLILLLGTLTLAACGQKGPLFLPKPAVEAEGDDNASEQEEESEGTTE